MRRLLDSSALLLIVPLAALLAFACGDDSQVTKKTGDGAEGGEGGSSSGGGSTGKGGKGGKAGRKWKMEGYEIRTFGDMSENIISKPNEQKDTTFGFVPKDFTRYTKQMEMMNTSDLREFLKYE